MVGYRYFTKRSARKLGIIGQVRNLSDGRVEVIAQGNETQLSEFYRDLLRGPIRADVEAVTVEKLPDSTGSFSSFEITY